VTIAIARPLIGDEERAAVDRVLRSGSLSQGPEVAAFEEEFSTLVDGRTCIAVNSGTSALLLALLAHGVGDGDEVIVPSFTFAATANAVRLVGGVPVFVDIDPATYCLAPDAVERAVTPRTAAVMPVHLYGHPAAMDQLERIAGRHGLLLLEDAAQAHGATLDGRAVGTWGTAAFSFYPTKNMTTGEGGMVVTADDAVARRARLLRNQGMDRPYENELAGYNLRMTDLAAAIGRVQLRRLPDLTAARQANAARYDEALADVVSVPSVAPGAVHVYHQYTVRSPDRDGLQRTLEARGVESRVYYPHPVHRLPAFGSEVSLPESEKAAAQVLSIPVGPHLGPHDVETVIEAVRS
jgi:dTDP-4-amino-4,6-dideoxygalactose transaminase